MTNAPSRRTELADLLRTRRARLSPLEVGLPTGRRRRVPGLRREEVAELAGISATWYTWLEQGRQVEVSAATLDRLASAFRMEGREREHLYLLAGHIAPPVAGGNTGKVLEVVRQAMESMNPNPAYLLNARWDVLAWNRAAARIFGDFGSIPEHERNIVWLTFKRGTSFSQLFADWNKYARCVLGNFRVDSSLHAGDPQWSELTSALLRESAVFAEWWPNHEVAAPLNFRKELLHPEAGRLTFEALHLDVQDPAGMTVVTYLPCNDTDTRARLEQLEAAICGGR